MLFFLFQIQKNNFFKTILTKIFEVQETGFKILRIQKLFFLLTQIKYRNAKIKLNQIVCANCELTREVVLRILSICVFIKHKLSILFTIQLKMLPVLNLQNSKKAGLVSRCHLKKVGVLEGSVLLCILINGNFMIFHFFKMS